MRSLTERDRSVVAAAAALVLVLAPACTGESQGEDDADADAETETETEGETDEPPALGDQCEDTTLIVGAPTTVAATLRNATPSTINPSCTGDGPVVFVRISVEDRADLTLRARGRAFTPRLAVLLPGCVSAEDDPARLLACAGPLPATLTDIGPDAELLVALGIDGSDPALDLPAPGGDDLDPLDFELDLELRAVLAEGQACGLGQGRCEAGTVCLSAEEGGGVEIERCHRPPADSCVAPGQLWVPEPGAALEFDILPDEPHSDAHEHPCTGWRRPERVELLELPAALPTDATLVLRADDGRVGLALRGPSCLPEHALACAPAIGTNDQTELTWGGEGELSALAEAGDPLLLFIELPRPDDDANEAPAPDPIGPISVSVEIVDH